MELNPIEKLLSGSIDMHIHHSPDPRAQRRMDALQLALEAEKAGMKGIVLKSHDYPTAPVAYTVNQMVTETTVFGSITLNHEVGGLNPYAVEASAKMGAKIVWMPTLASANDVNRKGGDHKTGIALMSSDGALLPPVLEILDIIKSHEVIVATGHVSVEESVALVKEAQKRKLPKIMVTHPLSKRVGAHLTLEQQAEMVARGAVIEHCFLSTLPLHGRMDPLELVAAIQAVGAEHVVLSTDLGQSWNPAPAEAMRMAIATLIRCGITEQEIELMVKTNPARLLDL